MAEMDDRLGRMKARLAKMNAKSDALKQEVGRLEQQAAEQARAHETAEGEAAAALAAMKVQHNAERATLAAQLQAARDRRAELKADYGDLYEMVGQIEKATTGNAE